MHHHTYIKRAKHRVLVVSTNHSEVDDHGQHTGVWLPSIAEIWRVFANVGIEVAFASPNGGESPIDERSQHAGHWSMTANYGEMSPLLRALKHTTPACGINPADYSCVHIADGRGGLADITGSGSIKYLAESIYDNGGALSSVGHGSGALAGLKDSDGLPLLAGRRATGYSNIEEILFGQALRSEFFVENRMKRAGAIYSRATVPFTSYLVTDDGLFTGQNPQSAAALAGRLRDFILGQSRPFICEPSRPSKEKLRSHSRRVI